MDHQLGILDIGCATANFPAIAAAKVVGYYRLIGRDESGVLTRLRKNRAEALGSAQTEG
jgi:hypothetical protein